MTFARVVKTPVCVITDSSSQDYTHLDDHNSPTYDVTLRFKLFTVTIIIGSIPASISGALVR